MDSVCHFLSILKKICKIAFKEGHSERFHFAHYKLPKQKETTPKALSWESFEKIRDFVIPENHRSHSLTRDLFLFFSYTGVSYADIVRIISENLFTDEENNLWLKITESPRITFANNGFSFSNYLNLSHCLFRVCGIIY